MISIDVNGKKIFTPGRWITKSPGSRNKGVLLSTGQNRPTSRRTTATTMMIVRTEGEEEWTLETKAARPRREDGPKLVAGTGFEPVTSRL